MTLMDLPHLMYELVYPICHLQGMHRGVICEKSISSLQLSVPCVGVRRRGLLSVIIGGISVVETPRDKDCRLYHGTTCETAASRIS